MKEHDHYIKQHTRYIKQLYCPNLIQPSLKVRLGLGSTTFFVGNTFYWLANVKLLVQFLSCFDRKPAFKHIVFVQCILSTCVSSSSCELYGSTITRVKRSAGNKSSIPHLDVKLVEMRIMKLHDRCHLHAVLCGVHSTTLYAYYVHTCKLYSSAFFDYMH